MEYRQIGLDKIPDCCIVCSSLKVQIGCYFECKLDNCWVDIDGHCNNFKRIEI